MPLKLAFLLVSFFITTLSYSQKINQHKNKLNNGRWVLYHDASKTKIESRGRYKKGIQKGKWRYYEENGSLSKVEIYRFKKIKTTFYHPNGKIKKLGQAKIVIDEKELHYYYFGNWLVYDSAGTLIKKITYKDGINVSEVNYKSSFESIVNDSLVAILRLLDKEIYKYHDSIKIAEKTFGKNSPQYQRQISLNALHTSKLLDELNKLIEQFGYPGRTLVGQESTIAFSIISSANIEYKEKYYKIIIDAADKGELAWSDVAFFVDKVKVAKKEKQIYGTQFMFNEQQKIRYYPIEDINNLNKRREKAGLDDEELSEMEFIDY